MSDSTVEEGIPHTRPILARGDCVLRSVPCFNVFNAHFLRMYGESSPWRVGWVRTDHEGDEKHQPVQVTHIDRTHRAHRRQNKPPPSARTRSSVLVCVLKNPESLVRALQGASWIVQKSEMKSYGRNGPLPSLTPVTQRRCGRTLPCAVSERNCFLGKISCFIGSESLF